MHSVAVHGGRAVGVVGRLFRRRRRRQQVRAQPEGLAQAAVDLQRFILHAHQLLQQLLQLCLRQCTASPFSVSGVGPLGSSLDSWHSLFCTANLLLLQQLLQLRLHAMSTAQDTQSCRWAKMVI